MLNKIINFSIKNKLIIGLLTIGLIGLGSYQLTKLPIDAVPDITNNQVQVITVAPSYGATDIERLITFPIEQANSNINGLNEIRSFSRFGLSLVTIVFDDNTDIYWARQQVAERLQQIQSQIPSDIGTPSLGPVSTGLGEIYQYVVKPKKGYEEKYDATELRTIQDWIVRRQLLGVKGVAEVSSFGGKLKQYEIAIDPNKLNAFGININDVFSALEKNNQNTGGSYIEKESTVLFIRSEGLIGNKNDIENISIPIKNSSQTLFIRDIARVSIGYATRFGAMCYNDEGEVSGAIVMMLKGANSSEVINNVKERIAQIQKALPIGVEIEPFLDRSKMVNNAIGTVEKNLMEGALIVVFILVIFLGNLRAGLIVASVIPLAMLFAVCMMNIFGVSGNLMSLGALDFGLIVDGAVIIVEAVMHRLSLNSRHYKSGVISQTEMDGEVTHAAGKMMNSAVFGQIIILIVYLPIFSLEGIEGKMFKPMAQTVAFALLGAFILSLTYIPMLSSIFLSKKVKKEKNFSDKIMLRVEQAYQKVLIKAIRIPKLIIGSIVILFMTSIAILSQMGGEFIPSLEEGDFAVDTRVLTGSSLNTTIETTQKAAHILKSQFPEVIKVVTKIGSGEVPTDPMPMEACDMMVILKNKKEWTSAKSFSELSDKMTKALSVVPGITMGFQYPVQMRFNELMTGARQDVVCKIFGENLDTLSANGTKLASIINSVEGAENIYLEPITGMPQIVIEFNRQLIAQYHLSIDEINKIINTAFAGKSTGLVYEEEKRFDLVVKLDKNKRENLEDVKNLLIPNSNGTQIPLSLLANVSIKDGPNQIQREDAKRRIVVGFNVKNRDVQSIVQELKQKVETQMDFSPGYFVTYGGAFENLNKAKKRLVIAVPIALALIFILLFFAFKSVKQGLLIYTAIPLSAIGGILFLAMRGMPFSISAGIGFIALFGVAVLNGIVLVAEFNSLKERKIKNLNLIVLRAGKNRLRPVLMTAFVASLGFLPMALSNGAGAEVQRPLATVVIGGLIIATFLTLFLLPILYILFERNNKPKVNLMSILLIAGATLTMNKVGAQTPISLQSAIDSALQNNLEVKNQKLLTEYQSKLLNSYDIPQTVISGEYGQINSYYKDSKFGISQTISFPQVYSKQNALSDAKYQGSIINTHLKEAELIKQISEVFFDIVYMREKRQILVQYDSLFGEFINKTKLKFNSGEANILEVYTAETQKNEISIQLKQLKYDMEVKELEFELLLNTRNPYVPQQEKPLLGIGIGLDSMSFENHPLLKYLNQEKSISQLKTQVEKSKLLPNILLGYNSTSMVGTGADNILYSSSKRFNSIQFGLGLPLFYGHQQAIIRSSTIQEKVSENNYQMELRNKTFEYQQELKKYTMLNDMVRYFEDTSLLQAKTINETADKKFFTGDINYLEWLLLSNNATMIKTNYINAKRELNYTIIKINYLINFN